MTPTKKLLLRLTAPVLLVLTGGGLILSDLILARFDLAWRNRVVGPILVLLLLLFLISAGEAAWALACVVRKKKAMLIWRICAGVGAALVPVLTLLVLGASLVVSSFFYQPEHVMLREGTPYVVRVNSFLDVYLEYDAYHGRLVRGRTAVFSEYYGSGGYDPFAEEPDILP